MTLPDLKAQTADSGEIHVGTKVRHTRRLRGLTLKEVADQAGCSESLLSKIENGRANPSLKMLKRLAAALGLTVGQFFAQESNPDNVVMKAAARIKFETDPNGNGDKIEPLADHSIGHLLECHLHHIAPGGGSGGNFQHEGEEFGFVLEGEIELTVAGRQYIAATGDSFFFSLGKAARMGQQGKNTSARALDQYPADLLGFCPRNAHQLGRRQSARRHGDAAGCRKIGSGVRWRKRRAVLLAA